MVLFKPLLRKLLQFEKKLTIFIKGIKDSVIYKNLLISGKKPKNTSYHKKWISLTQTFKKITYGDTDAYKDNIDHNKHANYIYIGSLHKAIIIIIIISVHASSERKKLKKKYFKKKSHTNQSNSSLLLINKNM